MRDGNGEVDYKKGYMWVIVKLRRKVWYYVYGSGKKEVMKEFVGELKGRLMRDGYGG